MKNHQIRDTSVPHAVYKCRHMEVFFKKNVLKNYLKFIGKHLCSGLLKTKLQAITQNITQRHASAVVL